MSLVDGSVGLESSGCSWECFEAGVSVGELAGPLPSLGDGQVGASGGAHDSGGEVQELIAQLLRLGHGVFGVEEQGSGPGEQVDADECEFEPGGVDGELPRSVSAA
jgi:hypothetical protein